MAGDGRTVAVLGPTNTGKTHYAIERMLAYRTGIIGLPLRLLAREVYDRIVAARGPSVVALMTGEERIVPPRAAYWVCTVEAMPQMAVDFLAIDEIQLCGDAERGHVFTDRLLRARGHHETLFLGADSMRPSIAALVPGVRFLRRERFSQLSYTGAKKISRMPARSAIVGFSVDSVYAIAELLRRQKGGAAVVMGALSPRTRNAQVAMYQAGEVDYLVATDAIGMGLNLDIRHVAFAATSKFDGRRMRPLQPNELAQIAGRAGRHRTDGTFGVTAEAAPLDDGLVEAITAHRFAPVRKLRWRNAALDFRSAPALLASLEAPSEDERLVRAREADDMIALRALADAPEIYPRLRDARDVRLLWDVCRIPDFRGISHAEHAGLLSRIFGFLHEWGRVPDDWLARQVGGLDRSDGDIDAISTRLAYIRTWTYVAQRRGWVDDESHWRGLTRAVEDRLSDALHGALMQRFVDRRTSVLLRRLKERERLVAEVNADGGVVVEGQFVGRLDGFRFRQDATANPDEAKTVRQASLAALAPEFHLRADRLYNAPDPEIGITEQGGLMWGDQAVGRLAPGPEVLKPQVVAFVDDEAGAEVAAKVARRLQHYVDRRIAALFEPLLAMGRDEALTGLARGFAFRLVEALGVLPRAEVAAEVKELDQAARGILRKHGVRFGQFTIFLPALLKPAPTRLRLILWSLAKGLQEFPESPPPGLVTIPSPVGAPSGAATMAGYRVAGERAIRIDMLERLADMLRAHDSRSGFEATADMMSITGLTLEQFANLMEGLGYRAARGERDKVRAPRPATVSEEGAPVADTVPAGEVSVKSIDAGRNEKGRHPDASPPASDAVKREEVPPGAVPDVAGDGTGDAAAEDARALSPEAAARHAAAAGPATDVASEGDGQPDVEAAAAKDAATGGGTPGDAEQDAAGSPPKAEAKTPGPVIETKSGVEDAPVAGTAPGPETGTSADEKSGADRDAGEPGDERRDQAEREIFYVFTWAPRSQRRQARPDQTKKRGGPKSKGRAKAQEGARKPKTPKAPPVREKPIDPDNPFAAALMGLKTKR